MSAAAAPIRTGNCAIAQQASPEAKPVRQALVERGLETPLIDTTLYCVKSQDVMDANSRTQTTSLGGHFKEDHRTRAEFLA